MDTNKSLIIAAIVIVLVVLAGIVLSANPAPEPVENVGDPVQLEKHNVTAYEIPLKAEKFKNFEIPVPEGSNFTTKNKLADTDKGMKYYENKGNFNKDVLGISINRNMTDSLIMDGMILVKKNGSVKIYESENVGDDFYQVVKTFNGTDIIVSGNNLHVIERMLDNASVKDTKDLIKVVKKAPANKTPVQKTVEKTKAKKETSKVEKTAPKVETTAEEIKKTTYPLIIGGGMFTTGSGLSDLTHAQIYVGPEHSGETVKIKILYTRDGEALNQGNLVTKTVEGDGYIYVASADAYSKYPDYATVKVYDWKGNLQNTQGIELETRSGTQYF